MYRSSVSVSECIASKTMPYPDVFSQRVVERLDNGLTVCLLPDSRVPLVSTALYYRAGTREEEPGQGGIAHFLEHMMFKGSERYPAGAVDRRTQSLGGSNNAFTSHDATVYHFDFASDRWQEAIAIEADRMDSLRLDDEEVERERRVILEEISMIEDDPWAHLEEKVVSELFGDHAYGRPVLGTRDSVRGTGEEELRAFHHRFYGPNNAVLVVVGDLCLDRDLKRIDEAFSDLPVRTRPRIDRSRNGDGARSSRSPRRVEMSRGEVPRLFAVFPAPEAGSADHAALRLALAVLAAGRSSRMQRSLVEEGRLASWVSLDLSDMEEKGLIGLALEVAPGRDPKEVEAAARSALRDLSRSAPEDFELERAKAVLRAEWVLSHEHLHQRALTLGEALAFRDADFPIRYHEKLEKTGIEQVVEAAEAWLDPSGPRVIGWSGADEEGSA